ncbi:MAG: TatD family nuclease-associated radical SAM protein [Clostridiales bacterium]|nr:TatD family nuclease-associated radical SAM protein [Clostridiales bacterium]
MADIIYTLEGGVYFNITNKCPCACSFCIRKKGDAVGSAKRLWHDAEPTFAQIRAAVDSFDFSAVDKAVFCGYGEPTAAYDNLISTAKYLKKVNPRIKLRLNTNGLSDLINKKETAKEICSVIDIISVSLNAPTAEKYDNITKNKFSGAAFGALIKFTKDCVACGNEVYMTVVDVIPQDEIELSREICRSCGAKFRLRSFARGR